MPQAAAGTWRTHAMHCLYGKGSLHADLLESTFRTRHRADRRNNEARHRLRLLARSLERSRREEDARSTTELAKARRAAEEIVAYREVLKSYAADKLWTLRPGFRQPDLTTTSDPAVLRRYRLERRLYSRGYGVETLYPEVLKAMRELNWEKRTDKVNEKDPERNKDKLLGNFETETSTATVRMKDDEKPTRLFHLDSISPPSPQPHCSDVTVEADDTKQQTSGRCSTQLPPIGRASVASVRSSSKDVVIAVDVVVSGRRRSSAVDLDEIQSQGQAVKKCLPSISPENMQSNLVIRQTSFNSETT